MTAPLGKLGAIIILGSLIIDSAGARAAWYEFGTGGRAILCVQEVDLDPHVKNVESGSKYLQLSSGSLPGFGFLFAADKMRVVVDGYRSVPEHSHSQRCRVAGSRILVRTQFDEVEL